MATLNLGKLATLNPHKIRNSITTKLATLSTKLATLNTAIALLLSSHLVPSMPMEEDMGDAEAPWAEEMRAATRGRKRHEKVD